MNDLSEKITFDRNLKKFKTYLDVKLTFLDWIGVAVWKWIANDENCGICRMAFEACW